MPPLGFLAESHEVRPELDDGVKQILWSPASAAEKVKRPEDRPRWETTRWSLSKISCYLLAKGLYEQLFKMNLRRH